MYDVARVFSSHSRSWADAAKAGEYNGIALLHQLFSGFCVSIRIALVSPHRGSQRGLSSSTSFVRNDFALNIAISSSVFETLSLSILPSFVRSLVRSFVHSFFRSFVRAFVRSLVRSLVNSFARSLVRSLLRLLVHVLDP